MKPSVYIETSVISYLTAKPSQNLLTALRQEMTQDWWENIMPQCRPFVSLTVIEEISRGDGQAAALRLEKIKDVPSLAILEEIHELADAYFKKIQIPEKARADSYHLALASWHRLDYLVSWNCTHIVGARVRSKITEINAGLGIPSPTICTPEELMEVD